MRLIGLRAENIKRLKAIDIVPNKYINRISGANGAAKTSVLDAIEWALTGTSNVPKQPVRKGAGRAVIELDLGDIIVTRRFTEGGNRNGTLALESKTNKSRFQGPQEMLDKLMGKISFDPLEFLRMKADKQLEVLRSLVTLEINLEELDAANKADYLRRRELKKEKVAVETRRDAVYVPADLPKDKVDEAALVQELREVSEYNTGIEQQNIDRRAKQSNADRLKREMEQLQTQIENLNRQLNATASERQKADAEIHKWKPLAEPKDAAKLAEQITKARTVNQGIDRRSQRDSYEVEAVALEMEIDSLSTALDVRETAKTEALARAEFPVPGLAFGEDEVIYRGFPFGQVSNAEQIRCAVAIGMASNPELRVMRIKDGSLLDDNAMHILAEMSKAHDYQVWIEQVDTSGKIGVYLEDGEVVTVNPEPLNDLNNEEKKPSATHKRKKVQA